MEVVNLKNGTVALTGPAVEVRAEAVRDICQLKTGRCLIMTRVSLGSPTNSERLFYKEDHYIVISGSDDEAFSGENAGYVYYDRKDGKGPGYLKKAEEFLLHFEDPGPGNSPTFKVWWVYSPTGT